MGHKEKKIIDARLLSLKAHECRFRINAGNAFVAGGKDTLRVTRARTVKVGPGDVVLRNARVFHGAPVGWPDMCGWDTVVITPDMVGQKMAVFVFEEVKATGELSPGQVKFKKLIERMGGFFRVLRG